MKRVIRRRIRHRADGVDVAVDVNGVFAVNRGSSGVESVQHTSVNQTATARAADESRDRPGDHSDPSSEEER